MVATVWREVCSTFFCPFIPKHNGCISALMQAARGSLREQFDQRHKMEAYVQLISRHAVKIAFVGIAVLSWVVIWWAFTQQPAQIPLELDNRLIAPGHW
jgi:hypothetical protein